MTSPVNLDEILRNNQRKIRYDLRSYSIETISEKFWREDFYIPKYQRGFVWDKNRQSIFIESVLIGLPSTTLFCAENDDGRLEIIDGVQRIFTISEYVSGNLKLKGLETTVELNGTSFFDLSNGQKTKFLNRMLSVIILFHETPIEVRMEIFRRMCLGGTSKSTHEMRSALFRGPFLDFIDEMANNKKFLEIVRPTSNMVLRGEVAELVIRFFALLERLDKFRNDYRSFIDRYALDKMKDANFNDLRGIFEATVEFIHKYLRSSILSPTKRFSRKKFDAIFVGSGLAIQKGLNSPPKDLKWASSKDFEEIIDESFSFSKNQIKNSIQYVKDSLLRS